MTSPINSATTPQQITDNLIFTLESGVQQKVNLNVYSWDAELLKGLNVTYEYDILQVQSLLFYRTR